MEKQKQVSRNCYYTFFRNCFCKRKENLEVIDIGMYFLDSVSREVKKLQAKKSSRIRWLSKTETISKFKSTVDPFYRSKNFVKTKIEVRYSGKHEFFFDVLDLKTSHERSFLRSSLVSQQPSSFSNTLLKRRVMASEVIFSI